MSYDKKAEAINVKEMVTVRDECLNMITVFVTEQTEGKVAIVVDHNWMEEAEFMLFEREEIRKLINALEETIS